jgi:hypothetical protein
MRKHYNGEKIGVEILTDLHIPDPLNTIFFYITACLPVCMYRRICICVCMYVCMYICIVTCMPIAK